MLMAYQIVQRKVQQKIALKHKPGPMRDMLDSFLSRGLDVDQASSELIVVLYVLRFISRRAIIANFHVDLAPLVQLRILCKALFLG